MNALDKFDKVLMMVLRVLELKVVILDHVKEIQKRLKNLSGYRGKLETQIVNFSDLVNKAKSTPVIKETAAKKS